MLLAVVVVVIAGVGSVLWLYHRGTAPRTDSWVSSPVQVSADGRTVTLHYVGGECDKPSKVDVEERRDEVVLTVTTRESYGGCEDIGITKSIDARLAEPLGTRSLVDGACEAAGPEVRSACTADIEQEP
jgi:hypothetical protein